MNSAPDQHVDRRAARHITEWALVWAFVDTAVVYGALGWLYVVVIAVFYPGGLSIPIVSWIPMRRDTLGIVCFGLSAVAYFLRGIRKPPVGADDA